MHINNSIAAFDQAYKLFPGGVNSPVRAFKSVGGSPIFMKKGDGAYITDIDDNTYIDFCCSWGPLIHGHNFGPIREAIIEAVHNGTSFGTPTEIENKLAHLIISNHRSIEKIRFVNSGTEAVMSALRLARGITGRNKIIKFEGCYHGHVDALLVKAGSGLATLGIASSNGIPASWAVDTIVLRLNDIESFDNITQQYKNEIACVIIEPIPANNGLLLQDVIFLKHLRKFCDNNGSILIFDEVISGFRVGFEGGAGYYNIEPDIITFGKIIGGGMPVGAFGAKAHHMKNIAPDGDVYQAGTLSGNPIAMSAGYASLSSCMVAGFYDSLANRTRLFAESINTYALKKNYPFYVQHIGSIFWMIFGQKYDIHSADEIDENGIRCFNNLYHRLLYKGIYFGPSGYEVGFVSNAHTTEILLQAADQIMLSLDEIFNY